MEVGGLGERVVGQPRGRQSGCRFEVGGTEINRVLMVMMMMMEDTSWSQLMVVLVSPET